MAESIYPLSPHISSSLYIFILSPKGSGYIGFQEANSNRSSKTRLISLDPSTRLDAASEFFGEAHVPTKAIVMGKYNSFKEIQKLKK